MAIDFGTDQALEAIAKVVRSSRCVLFLGAGVHVGPPKGSSFDYPEQDRPPRGEHLSTMLAEQCRLHDHYASEKLTNLQRVSLFYELGRSRQELVEAVEDLVQTNKRPSPMLRALAELDFPVVITTNYDSLFEQALEDAGKAPRVSVHSVNGDLEQQLEDLDPQRPIVLKLHGDISLPESIVITDEDYIDFVREMTEKEPDHPFPLSLKTMLIEWTTLFVGYSLSDYNLRLLFRTLRWRLDKALVRPMYSVDMYPDALIRDVWENERRYIRFIVEDVWAFVPDLYEQLLGEELRP